MHTPQLLEHFRNPKYVGDLPAPAVTVEVANPACGDTMRLSVLWGADGRIARAGFRSRGCTASIAAGSVLTEWLHGRTEEELAALRPTDIDASLGGLPPASSHVAALCCDAVQALLKASASKSSGG